MTNSASPNLPTSGQVLNSTSVTLSASWYHDEDGGIGGQFELRNADTDAVLYDSGAVTLAAGFGNPPSSGIYYAAPQTLAEGSYKWRLAVNGVWGSFIPFSVHINHAPTASIASPSAGANVGTLTPTLTVNFSDSDTYGSLGTFTTRQLQVRRQSDAVSFWDPGQVATSGAEQTARAASVVYAGTALSNGVTYEVRARVQDGGGLWSDYTSWIAFTPNVVPNPPTIVGPSGLQTTLTPTISGTYNQGSGGTEAAFQYEVRQNLTTIYQSGDVATAIATGQAYGTNNPSDTPSSPPALAWGTSYDIRMRSKDNAANYSDWTGWTSFNTKSAPTTPTSLSPSGGAVTPDTTPDLSWVHNDPDGYAQTAVEIELYDLTAAAYVAGYNPKALSQATLVHTVATALTLTHNYQWRIRTKGLAGAGFGPWSSYATFSVATVPSVSLTSPTVDQVLTSGALTVSWTFGGGSGTQQDYRVKVYADDGTTVVWDSTQVSGVGTTVNVPAGTLHNNLSYFVQATVRDTLSQAAVTTLTPFSTSWTPPTAPTSLIASAIGGQS